MYYLFFKKEKKKFAWFLIAMKTRTREMVKPEIEKSFLSHPY